MFPGTCSSWGPCLLFYIFVSCLPSVQTLSTLPRFEVGEDTTAVLLLSLTLRSDTQGGFWRCVPAWGWECYECLGTTFSSISLSDNLWKVVPWNYRDTLFMVIVIDCNRFWSHSKPDIQCPWWGWRRYLWPWAWLCVFLFAGGVSMSCGKSFLTTVHTLKCKLICHGGFISYNL